MPFGIPSEDFHGGFGIPDEDERVECVKQEEQELLEYLENQKYNGT